MPFQVIIVRCVIYMLSISAENKSQAVMWRVLDSSLCASIHLCRLLCEELTFKMYLKFVSMYLLEVRENTPFGSWIHQS